MFDPGLIWRITLSLLSLVMFAFLIARRAWDELRERQLAVRRRAIRHKLFLLLDIDHERFLQRCTAPGYFSAQERRLLHEECMALIQIIKGRDQERIVEVMRRLHFHRDDLLDLQRGSENYRHAAALSLRYFNDAPTREALLRALEDRSSEVALAAAQSLQALDTLPPLDQLLPALTRRGLLQAAACRTLFHRIAQQTPARLVDAERRFTTHAGIRSLLAEAMGHASDYSVLPALQRLAQDPDHGVRIDALRALARLQHPAAAPIVLQQLEDTHPEVCSAAVVAAGELGMTAAIPRLDALLGSENWVLRFNTALSLYQLGVAGRRVLLRRTRSPDDAGRTANLVLSEKGVSALLPTW